MSYKAVLPGGKTKSYSSVVARDALVARTPGAYALPDPPRDQ